MRKSLLMGAALLVYISAQAQLTTAPNGGNKKAIVGERIGITDVTIHYDRPGVKGREGKIWGGLVANGFTDLGFGNSKAAPWRAGANENTVIEFSDDVKIEGQTLPAGKYAFFIATDPNECTLIFSKNFTSWGSFFYDPKEDALRVKVKPVVQDKSTEWLKYEFENETDNSAVIALTWEKWKIPFKVEVDYNKSQLESFRRELRSDKGFTWNSWQQAAQYCIDNNTNLQEGLQWADYAINGQFIGDKNFQTLSTKAQLLAKLNRNTEADAIMKEALPMGKMNEIHAYARQLLAQKRGKEAYEVFKMNYDKNPNTFTTNMGLARGYSAIGNYKEALKYAQAALPQAPDPGNKTNVQTIIEKLKAGTDINQ
ncbi:MAG: DUF2911 domain-containing protein [Panacibacter sp.]